MRARIVLLALSISAVALAEDRADLSIVHRIRAEAFQNSQVMDTLFYLTDVNGPRVTNSSGFKSAADWVVKRLEGYGLVNVKQEPWGVFGRSWNYSHYEGHMLEPQYAPLIGFPLAWTPGTNGMKEAEAVLAPLNSEADFEKYKGKLRGKMVLAMTPKELAMPRTPLGHRLPDEELFQRSLTPDPSRPPFGPGGPANRNAGPPPDPAAQR